MLIKPVPGWVAILTAFLASLLLYFLVFGVLVSRPMTIDISGEMMRRKTTAATAADGPKLVVIAGSNARFSHSCAVIAERLGRPCINAGIHADTSLEWTLDTFEPLLKAGDLVYLPLEYDPWTYSRQRMLSLQDSVWMFRHDRASLWPRGPEGIVRAAFGFDLPFLIHAIGETGLKLAGVSRRAGVAEINDIGDAMNTGDEFARNYEAAVAALKPLSVDAQALGNPDTPLGRVLTGFITRTRERGVIVVGGLPTRMDDGGVPDTAVPRLRHFYTSTGALFLDLPNAGLYPRHCMFDTYYHLRDRCRTDHSNLVAAGLAPLWPTARKPE